MKTQRYRITIQGYLGQSWSAYFAGMTLAAQPSGVTRLTGEIADQSALHGLLNCIRDLDLRLVSVQLLDGDTPVECRHCPLGQPSPETD
ncbi:MAG: hypothetical protein M0Z94_07665 [Dehalococcoidales bacterium]|nr:hypothetical protein [Dehalococcoidales bacterium]